MLNEFVGIWNTEWTGGQRDSVELTINQDGSGSYAAHANGTIQGTFRDVDRTLSGTWHQDGGGGSFTFVLQGDNILSGVWNGGLWNATRKSEAGTSDTAFLIRDGGPSGRYWSEDIIPWGPNALQNADQYLLGHWDEDVGSQNHKRLTDGEYNYVYVRAQNQTSETQSAKIFLFRSSGPHLATSPLNWTKLQTADGANYAEVIAPPHGKVVAPTAFLWDVPAGQGHTCLIAVASHSDDPLPKEPSWTDYYNWCMQASNASWRNIDFIGEGSEAKVEATLLIENLHSTPERIAVSGTLPQLAQGTTASISLECAEEGPDPMIDVTNPASSPKSAIQYSTLPPNFKGVLVAKAEISRLTTWPTGVDFKVMYFKVPPGHQETDDTSSLILLGVYTLQGPQ
ncbi:MAG: hypothetical protein ETSY1_06860 [Candidatus Entotheonella factor]|uniref:Uncharacterized protein n=1 Tax=Entotheonella factor TaxID=1429438 RepID=W4LW17_ENTF1|nr:MAG: hypothetical protein ETSY1_06860 [Candidatus Entotheonella factor]